jgi:hypothetical protein
MTADDNKPDEVEPRKYWCLVAMALRKIARDLNYRTPQNNRQLRATPFWSESTPPRYSIMSDTKNAPGRFSPLR